MYVFTCPLAFRRYPMAYPILGFLLANCCCCCCWPLPLLVAVVIALLLLAFSASPAALLVLPPRPEGEEMRGARSEASESALEMCKE